MKILGLVLDNAVIVVMAFLTDASIEFLLWFSKIKKSRYHGGLMGDSFESVPSSSDKRYAAMQVKAPPQLLKTVLLHDIWVSEKSLFHTGACWRLCGRIEFPSKDIIQPVL
ncbi:hypothetical protein Bca52824_010345 [Brassica carinata]|uniref:Uncharacterized protein n=1 Tax=Brassica carinata TaxID=52824 RepID=A0A8X7WE36_BRACI|nr:hypothetical protein Bca52824_010345 [Brassica carinata]